MQETRRLSHYLKISTLLLGFLVFYSQFAFAGNASARMVTGHQGYAHARITRNMKPLLTTLAGGKVIVVSLSQQWMYVYENGQEILDSPVTTGRPQLPTPVGIYHIFHKASPTTFYSMWPKGSPYYYPPTHIDYALEWRPGYYIHDSWWHTVYGPGTNGWHQDPTYGWQWGSHGCISVPHDVAAYLYQWAPPGTIVEVVR